MAQGAAYKAKSSDINWYYLKSSNRPTLPADLAAANAIAVAANRFMHTSGDPIVPAVNGGGLTIPNIEWREHGSSSVVYVADITPAPSADENSFDLNWICDMTNDLHEALATATANTYATLIVDVQTDAGDGTRGVASGNAEGTLLIMTVQHADATITVPSTAVAFNATTSFRVIDDAAAAKGRSVMHYGEA